MEIRMKIKINDTCNNDFFAIFRAYEEEDKDKD
jgi:hypothetical protein